MRKLLSTLLCIIVGIQISILQSEAQQAKSGGENTLTTEEVREGWKLLFDGKTFNGWRGLGRQNVPGGYWVIENGQIHKLKNSSIKELPDGTPPEPGDLMTVEAFENFELVFDWKIDKAGNSGLKYNVSEEVSQKYGSQYSALGFEYQLIDDSDPAYKDLKPAQFSGSLYDLIPSQNVKLNPVGEFNTGKIILRGNHAEHWLNGVKVVEYELDSKELIDAYMNSKFNKIPVFCDKKKGHIIIQNHNDEAWFRNIKIREL